MPDESPPRRRAGFGAVPGLPHEQPETGVVILQTCVPDYRVAVFAALAGAVPGLSVAAGAEHFAADITTRAQGQPWYVAIQNRFIFHRKLLWQRGAWRAARQAGVVIVEWNPRVLSTWLILVHRWFGRRPTLLWGHVKTKHRGLLGYFAQVLRKTMARRGNGIVTYTRTEANAYRALFPGFPIWAAPNSDVQSADIAAAMAEPRQRPADTVFVGRLTAKKKPALLLQAWLAAQGRLPPHARLIFVGAGAERARLEAMAEAGKPVRPVRFLGHVNDPVELRRIYRQAVVATSPGYVGLSAIQAMGHGVPMLVARDELHSPEIEACREGVTAQFFASDSAESLAESLVDIYGAAPAWSGRRQAIATFIKDHYSIERMVQGFERALTGLAVGEGRHRAVLMWEQFGPYHFARLRAAQRQSPAWQFIGCELSTRSSYYRWERNPTDPDIHCLELQKPSVELGVFTVFRRAKLFFSKINAQVVFVPSYWPPWALAIYLAARSEGMAAVMMNESHAETSQASGPALWVKRFVIRSFDAGLVGGTPQLQYFESEGLPRNRMFDGYDAVDNAYFGAAADECRQRAAAVKQERGLPASYFLSIGRMEQKKNLFSLVAAYAIAKREFGFGPKLVFVGDGKTESALRDYCADIGLTVRRPAVNYAAPTEEGEADVYFYGFRQVSELPGFYALAVAFVLPSRREEWGLVVNEAMACGTPVVVSEFAGCAPDLVQPHHNGLTFDPENSRELAGHLVYLASDLPRAATMGANARQTIRAWGCERFADHAVKAATLALNHRRGHG